MVNWQTLDVYLRKPLKKTVLLLLEAQTTNAAEDKEKVKKFKNIRRTLWHVFIAESELHLQVTSNILYKQICSWHHRVFWIYCMLQVSVQYNI